MRKKHWYDYLWLWTILYFTLGFFNILFAWLGMVDFLLPLFLAVGGGNKLFCNKWCGRGQLFSVLGRKFLGMRRKVAPAWLASRTFRLVFLAFFMLMFVSMLHQTYLVAAGARSLKEVVTIFWAFHLPWSWAYTAGSASDWVSQYSFGLYSTMLTSLLIGLIVMFLYRPRTWCTFCPMGTMTQEICKLKNTCQR